MILKPCKSSPSISKAILAALALTQLASCSMLGFAPEEPVAPEATGATYHEKTKDRSFSNQFEWGVQNYEAGDYPAAIKQFLALQRQGAKVPDFDLIPFYLGMSYFKMNNFPDATALLRGFAGKSEFPAQQQEAIMALLFAYEAQNRWKDLSTLASDSDRYHFFQNNKLSLKLLWARALVEQNELLGAKAVLKDAEDLINNLPAASNSTLFQNPNQDIQGRFFYTQLRFKEMECGALKAREVKGQPHFYLNWLEAEADCLRQMVRLATEEIFSPESLWAGATSHSLERGFQAFGAKIRRAQAKERGKVARHRSLSQEAKQNLYRILSAIDESLKILKKQGVISELLIQNRKSLDHLIVSLSVPSS